MAQGLGQVAALMAVVSGLVGLFLLVRSETDRRSKRFTPPPELRALIDEMSLFFWGVFDAQSISNGAFGLGGDRATALSDFRHCSGQVHDKALRGQLESMLDCYQQVYPGSVGFGYVPDQQIAYRGWQAAGHAQSRITELSRAATQP